MRWWGWTVLGVVVLVLVGLFVWPGWLRGDTDEVAEGGKPPKVETVTPAPAPAASDKKDEAPAEPVHIAETCGALRVTSEQNMPGDTRCEMLQAECQTALAACPECQQGPPDAVAQCLANCKQKCEQAAAKAKPKKAKAKAPLATAGGSPPPPAPSPAPRPKTKEKGSVVWWTTDLDGTIHQWK